MTEQDILELGPAFAGAGFTTPFRGRMNVHRTQVFPGFGTAGPAARGL